MKIVFFVENGKPTVDDFTTKSILVKDGHKVTFSNGNIPYGFQDSCHKVVMSKSFDHVIEWCESAGIEYSIGGNAVDMEEAEFVEVEEATEEETEIEAEEEILDEETVLREKYLELFGKKAGNMKLENIKAAIEAKEQEETEEE